ncbi:MAG: amidohydrolase family protein [Actinobacteria bacterium]|nr:amidohydrolase family protein [Actinomycetota bacterium]
MPPLTFRAPMAWLGPGHVVHDAAVQTDRGVVRYAGPAEGAPAAGGEVLEVDGFLLPAPADRHVHIGLSDPGAVLLGGVTAVRDLAWPADEIFALADASEGPSFTGPLIRASGPMLTAPGGYPTRSAWAPPGTGLEIGDPADVEGAVAALAARGATQVKVSLNAEAGPTPDDAVLAAIVSAARERRIPVTAHVQGRGEAERALGAGVDELAHCPWTEELDDRLIRSMARSGMRVVSTLHIHALGGETEGLRRALGNLRRFHRAGGDVLYGTDLGNGAIPPGIDVDEAALLAEAGLSTEAILRAMHRAPLFPGAPADLITLAEDPLESPEAFRAVGLVVRAGRVVRGT